MLDNRIKVPPSAKTVDTQQGTDYILAAVDGSLIIRDGTPCAGGSVVFLQGPTLRAAEEGHATNGVHEIHPQQQASRAAELYTLVAATQATDDKLRGRYVTTDYLNAVEDIDRFETLDERQILNISVR